MLFSCHPILFSLIVSNVLTITISSKVPPAVSFYTDNGLQQTVVLPKAMAKVKHKETENEILNLLGLHHRPQPNKKGIRLSAPRFMIRLYRSLRGGEEGEIIEGLDPNHGIVNSTAFYTVKNSIASSDTIMSFINQARKLKHLRHQRGRTFYFDFTDVTSSDTAMLAELRLYKRKSQWLIGRTTCEVVVYRIKHGQAPEDKLLSLETTMTVSSTYVGWINLNVTRVINLWGQQPAANLGLFTRIICKGHEVPPRRFGIVGRKGRADKQPFMVGFFRTAPVVPRETTHSRSKRAADKRKKSRRRSRRPNNAYQYAYADQAYSFAHYGVKTRVCQRRSLYVSFKALGWQDWIIAPDGYSSFYCSGECSFPMDSHKNATNHAIVQTLVHMMSPGKVPQPCCAPTKLSTISVLYFDDNSNVILKKYRNMVVKACGCH